MKRMTLAAVLLATFAQAHAQTGTPATEPAPQPAPVTESAPVAPAKPTFTFGSPATLQVTTTLVSITRAEQATLWGSLTSEMLVFPGLSLAVSYPIAQTPSYKLLGRATAETYFLYGAFGADLLMTNASGNFYGGPSAALVVGGNGGWMAGGLLGYRHDMNLMDGRLGYFLEAKVRYLVLKDAISSDLPPYPGYYGNTVSDFTFPSPGLKLGLTYKF